MRPEGVITAANVFTAACGLLFVVVYFIYAKWTSSRVGRNVMMMCGAITTVLLFAILIRFLPDEWERTLLIVRSFGVVIVGVLLLDRAHIVYKMQKKKEV